MSAPGRKFRYNSCMGRGENNILFNPPKIKKREEDAFFSVMHDSFPKITGEVLAFSGRILIRDADGAIYLNEEKKQGLWSEWRKEKIPRSAKVALTENAIVSCDDFEGCLLSPLNDMIEPNFFFAPNDIYPLDFYLSEETVYILAREDKKGCLRLYRRNLNKNNSASKKWETVSSWESRDGVNLIQKGAVGMLSTKPVDENPFFEYSLRTITPSSTGEMLLLDKHGPDIEAENWEQLVVPLMESKHYYHIQTTNEGGSCLILADLGNNIKRSVVDLPQDTYHSLQVSEERDNHTVLLLGDKGLYWVLPDDSIEIYETNGIYQEMTLDGDKVILWNKGKQDCLRIHLKI
jgi:hypothetical protein